MSEARWPTTLTVDRAAALVDSLEPGPAPFSDGPLTQLDAISRELMGNKHLPDVVALGFWLRRRHLEPRMAAYLSEDGASVPRGVVFHVAPSNVDTMFAYSWAVSFLCGNANVVRVPSRATPEREAVLEVLGRLLDGDMTNSFVTYDSSETAISGVLSRHADARLLWGGDATISALRQLPTKPTTLDIAFADKRSLATLNAAAIVSGSDAEVESLARRFHGDAYAFGQRACSSPHLVVWVGEETRVVAAQQRFWLAVTEHLRRHPPVAEWGSAIDRLVQSTVDTIRGGDVSPDLPIEGLPVRCTVSQGAGELRSPGGGYFYEARVAALAHLASWIAADHQTLTYWGFERDVMRRWLAALPAPRPLRVVPVGQALAFDLVWDGYDLPRMLSLRVAV